METQSPKDYIRKARIDKSMSIVTDKNLVGKLNNTKWREIFEIIRSTNSDFRIKLLTDEYHSIMNDWNQDVIELETSVVLTNNFGKYGFIEFREIERLDIRSSHELIKDLESDNMSFELEGEIVSIYGY